MRYLSNVEAISFDEFVQHGRDNGGNIVGGMPWSFKYKGYAVTHENDTRYLILRLTEPHTLNFFTDDMLVSTDDDIFIMKASQFHALFKSLKDLK
jgi:hypothetical protein